MDRRSLERLWRQLGGPTPVLSGAQFGKPGLVVEEVVDPGGPSCLFDSTSPNNLSVGGDLQGLIVACCQHVIWFNPYKQVGFL